jgi:hypothetical protein
MGVAPQADVAFAETCWVVLRLVLVGAAAVFMKFTPFP